MPCQKTLNSSMSENKLVAAKLSPGPVLPEACSLAGINFETENVADPIVKIMVLWLRSEVFIAFRTMQF